MFGISIFYYIYCSKIASIGKFYSCELSRLFFIYEVISLWVSCLISYERFSSEFFERTMTFIFAFIFENLGRNFVSLGGSSFRTLFALNVEKYKENFTREKIKLRITKHRGKLMTYNHARKHVGKEKGEAQSK